MDIPLADAIDFWRSIGLLVFPTLAVIIVLLIGGKRQYKAGEKAGRQLVDVLRGKKATDPVYTRCPSCGSARYKRTEASSVLSLVYDRICKECDTQYTPPTPRWMFAAAIPIGVVLAAISVYGMYRRDALTDLAIARGWLWLICIAVAFLGVATVIMGIGGLRKHDQDDTSEQ